MAELLLEVFSEEIPARMQARAAADLGRLVGDRLKAAELACEGLHSYVTARRLTLVARGLPTAQPDAREEKRGPRADAPDKAIGGFLRANGLRREQCEERETDKGVFLFAVIERQGRPTGEVLAELLPEVLAALPWPKSMRWGSGATRWVRPLHSILALFDGAVVDFAFADLTSGDTTAGHRFHAPEPIVVTGFDDYRDKLAAARVLIDPAERQERILAGARALAKGAGLSLVEDPGLLAEIAGLVEWPVPVLGAFDPRFMAVPPEVLVTTMKVNQKYLSLRDGKGELASNFIAVANLEAADGGRQIAAGNEYVLGARLADAEFFWNQDRRQTLESRLPALAEMVFHAKLGSLADKVARIEALAGELAGQIPGAEAGKARRAAHLAKADLVSDMVYEFPELQGVMGRYYALNDGEDEAVAQAIAEHYSPAGPNDDCPSAPISLCVALADKLDTLVGFWSIDEKPSGSRDPFALRRAALGVIRMVLENALRLPLAQLFAVAREPLPNAGAAGDDTDLLDFFADRLKVHLREQGVRHDLVAAVFALGDEDDLSRLVTRVAALSDFVDSDDGGNLLVAYRRAANILRIEEKKDAASHDGVADRGLLRQDEERTLAAALSTAIDRADQALAGGDFSAAMSALSALRQPVDGFFEEVTVNTDDPELRGNRLRLLSEIRATLHKVADFSQIEG
ncbi:MAG: glycine--tRNA ligase subunit beta [Alphaproteobacteria bacterium]|jgi:glycyl-tRNA synthetase beta chain|nr:glycine--tRNA ligase subunit beta [Alphaproteobacteria bacterium]MDP6566079.1 glycine--tRNA ligase subunit beta [Alphaproteobacteria bacterium]MDP6812905.1 glycine--tRNA ligase subunit beta [Alphaproteobacteria bacterium]